MNDRSSRDRGDRRYTLAVGRSIDPQLQAVALTTLRSLRSKLAAIVDRNGGFGLEQVFLIIDAHPPAGTSGGSIGGDDQYLTPENLTPVNVALVLGGEQPIIFVAFPPNDWRSPTEIGASVEHVGKLLPRVSRAIEHLSAGRSLSQSASRRGCYGRSTPRVAGFSDSFRLDRLTHEYDATWRALAEQTKVRPEWAGWFVVAVEPVYKAWNTFRKSAGESIDSSTYKAWSDKLDVIRAGAKAFGMKPPTSLNTVALIGGGVILGLVVLAAGTGK